MAIRATRRVADHDKSIIEPAEADDPLFAVVPPLIDGLERWACEDVLGVFKIQTSLAQRDFALGLVVRDWHTVNVATKTSFGKLRNNTRIRDVERQRPAAPKASVWDDQLTCLATRPPIGISRIVNDGKNLHQIAFNREENGIRKPREQGPAHTWYDLPI
jgi:hypothetical protein